ncbi:MAG TPA: sodium:proton antiporter [Beijerinckiaceae bacterium]|nr:sodium:proton antiporter [Beijerinckiaceae bacterium]
MPLIARMAPLALTIISSPVMAAEGLDGKSFGIGWSLPFAGLLLTMALAPLFLHRTWEHHYGKIAAGWALVVLIPLALTRGFGVTLEAFLHAMLVEYMPFIILLFALYTIAGGILVTGNLRGTPATNTTLLLIGTILASFVGTTGASMIMIRPVCRANDDRRHNVHVIIFFIFLVSNVGGSLTPLGDPPLFVGFLRGVDFFWTTKALFWPTVFVAAVLLAAFYALDTYLHAKDDKLPALKDKTPDRDIKIFGQVNFLLLAGVIAAILISASWKPGVSLKLPGANLPVQGLVRDAVLLALAGLSLTLTPKQVRAGNEFSWGAILEVGKLFAAIFVCVIPVLAMLQAGHQGALKGLVALVSNADGSPNPQMYYFLTGILSSFLDNAPTYLVFFELAGGDPQVLMTQKANILAAISLGAVYMGANTYIGNAPNLMVANIARDMGVKMPSFLGYMVWSFAILMPVLVLVGFVLVK